MNVNDNEECIKQAKSSILILISLVFLLMMLVLVLVLLVMVQILVLVLVLPKEINLVDPVDMSNNIGCSKKKYIIEGLQEGAFIKLLIVVMH